MLTGYSFDRTIFHERLWQNEYFTE